MPYWHKVVNQNMSQRSKVATKRKTVESIHDRDRIIVRLPDGMRDALAALAEANNRSMTSEVVAAIEQHLKGVDRVTQLWEFFERHRQQIEDLPLVRAAVENLENLASRTGDFHGVLRDQRLHKKQDLAAIAAALDLDLYRDAPRIAAEQVQQIRALLNEIGASEASLLKEMKVPSVESMHDLIFKRALSILEVWRREKKERPA
jgi:predicted DNA-binding protein